jgi:transcription initiation factor TFIIIB Brf1 subunit/transcription initiation factor TFIIB
MELKDIKKCPSCESKELDKKSNFIICKSCKCKIGINRNKIWYETKITPSE